MRGSGRGRSPTWLRAGAVVLAAALVATPVSAERLLIRTYTVADGLPAENVLCLITDRAGFLWVCTSNGLARFDGARFVVFGTAQGLPDPVINHFLQSRTGTRWVAMNGGGIARLETSAPGADGRVFTAFAVGNTPRSMRVNVLFETHDGVLLAGTDGGLFRARSADAALVFEPVPLGLSDFPDSGLQIWALAADAAGRIWIGTSGGLVLLAQSRPPVHFRVAPAQGADHVSAILTDAAGRLWLGHDGGLLVWAPPAAAAASGGEAALIEHAAPCVAAAGQTTGQWIPPVSGAACRWAPPGDGQRPSRIISMTMTPDGWIWMTSHTGVVAFDGERIRQFDAGDAVPASGAQRIGVDPGGDVWVGAMNGAHRILRRGFAHFTTDDGLLPELLQRIQRGPDGQLYAVTMGSRILRLDGERWTAVQPWLPPFVGIAGRSTYGAALLDRTGAWWIGTGTGLLRYPPVRRLEDLAGAAPVAHYTTADGLAGDDVWHLYEDARGDIWIATRIPGPEPLTRWDRSTGRFHRYGADAGLPAERAVRGFVEDGSGALWASLWDGGLARFDGRRFRYLAPGIDVSPGPRLQMVVDERGWLWVGGRQVAFSRDPTAAEPRFESFRTADGLTIHAPSLALEGDGWVLAGTPTGLVRMSGDGRLQQLGSGRPFAGLMQPIHRDEDGMLWLPREDHILRYAPGPAELRAPPPVWIGGVRVAGAPLPVPAMGATSLPEIRLVSGQRQIQIDWFALGFGSDELLRFQFRLDGANEEWSSPTSELSVVYAGLGPGRYRFEVRALSAAGEPGAEPATLAFVVPPPLYRRGWFGALMATMLAALLVTIHRARLRRALELERVRSRIAADLHDDIGASLARVSLLSEATRRTLRASPDAAEAMLGEIGDTSRDLVTAVGDVAFCIDPGRGGLDAFVARVRRFGDELLAGTGIDWAFIVHGETTGVILSSDQRRHLLAIVKEALHNALRHAGARRITLKLTVQASSLTLELRDDGRGFHDNGAADAAQAGHGLRNLRGRAHELGGRFVIESLPGNGTRLALHVPLLAPYRMSMQ